MKKKMERKAKRNILSCLLVISMIIPLLSGGMTARATEASDGSKDQTTEGGAGSEFSYEITEFRTGDTYSYPEKSGYVFAGWYEDAAYTTPIGTDVTTGNYFAKFVPAAVLGVQTQISANLLPPAMQDDSAKGAIRFVTSVDSLAYKRVGFYVTIKGTEYEYCNSKVYGQLFYIETNGTGVTTNPTKVTPKELFCQESQYFKTQTFIGIPASQFGLPIKVVPFWETLDGTIVRGLSLIHI